MKNLIMAVMAALIMVGTINASAGPKAKAKAKANKECCDDKTNCVCIPTGGGGCICVPKSSGTKAVAKVTPKANCPNRPGCVCK